MLFNSVDAHEFTFETDHPGIAYKICWSVDMPCSMLEVNRAAAEIFAKSVQWTHLRPLIQLDGVVRCFEAYSDAREYRDNQLYAIWPLNP